MATQTSAHPDAQLAGRTAVVVGASRGFGRAIAETLRASGADVLGIARDAAGLAALRESDPSIATVAGDATDPRLADQVIADRVPDVLAIIAGVRPTLRPLQDHTWETFSQAWDTDVQLVFHWLRAALTHPLRPGSRVLVMSSGAALAGSPLSGGYAGAKATIRMMAAYADGEARRSGLGIRTLAVLPRLTPATGLGEEAVRGYARRAGVSEAEYLAGFGETLTLRQTADAFLTLATGEVGDEVAYLLTAERGLAPLG